MFGLVQPSSAIKSQGIIIRNTNRTDTQVDGEINKTSLEQITQRMKIRQAERVLGLYYNSGNLFKNENTLSELRKFTKEVVEFFPQLMKDSNQAMTLEANELEQKIYKFDKLKCTEVMYFLKHKIRQEYFSVFTLYVSVGVNQYKRLDEYKSKKDINVTELFFDPVSIILLLWSRYQYFDLYVQGIMVQDIKQPVTQERENGDIFIDVNDNVVFNTEDKDDGDRYRQISVKGKAGCFRIQQDILDRIEKFTSFESVQIRQKKIEQIFDKFRLSLKNKDIRDKECMRMYIGLGVGTIETVTTSAANRQFLDYHIDNSIINVKKARVLLESRQKIQKTRPQTYRDILIPHNKLWAKARTLGIAMALDMEITDCSNYKYVEDVLSIQPDDKKAYYRDQGIYNIFTCTQRILVNRLLFMYILDNVYRKDREINTDMHIKYLEEKFNLRENLNEYLDPTVREIAEIMISECEFLRYKNLNEYFLQYYDIYEDKYKLLLQQVSEAQIN